MPQNYVKKLAKKHGTSTQRAEGKWAKAKAVAAKQGHKDNYAYVTSIFKNMMHESPYIPTLKDLTRGMSFKYFLVAEDETAQAPAKVRSPEWQHLEKFPQFNELPFKARRELEQEVKMDGLISDYEQLEPEEKESVDDALQELVIDKLEAVFGRGVNIGDWRQQEDEPSDDELSDVEGEDGQEMPEAPPPVRREHAPRHIAAMRSRPEIVADAPDAGAAADAAEVGSRKSYYKPWAALSDEQRAGRAALAKKHGKLYRIKNSKWYRLLSPEKQQAVVDAVKTGQPIPKFE